MVGGGGTCKGRRRTHGGEGDRRPRGAVLPLLCRLVGSTKRHLGELTSASLQFLLRSSLGLAGYCRAHCDRKLELLSSVTVNSIRTNLEFLILVR